MGFLLASCPWLPNCSLKNDLWQRPFPLEACHCHKKKKNLFGSVFWAQDRLSPHLFLVVGVWCLLLHTWFGKSSTHSIALSIARDRWGAWLGMCAHYPCMPGNLLVVTAGWGSWPGFKVFWMFGCFLCVTVILICFLRLFIEKLPKHRDYKMAVIPEKKDTVKVGLHFSLLPISKLQSSRD